MQLGMLLQTRVPPPVVLSEINSWKAQRHDFLLVALVDGGGFTKYIWHLAMHVLF